MQNPYQSPLAAQEADKNGLSVFREFVRISTVWVFFMSLITCSLYLLYWMYRRTKILNRLPGVEPIDDSIVYITLAFFALSFIVLVPEMAHPANADIAMTAQLITWASGILLLIWVFMFGNRLNQFLAKHLPGYDPLSSAGMLFMQVLYLSYKINEHLDMIE